jgi:3',5'-cyclic AMP phosphodiesterase CpdA
MTFLLAQISDLHLKAERRKAYGVVDTAAMLDRCVAAVLALPQRPHATIATGDLVDFGTEAEYGLLRELLAPLSAAMPLYLLPGNHDERVALRAAFPAHAYLHRDDAPFVQWAIDDHPLRLVALDTVVPGRGDGTLCAERLGWLDRTLGMAPRRPTLLAMHHPPFATGIGHMDRIGLDGSARLAEVVRRHPQVERIVCGHLHRSIVVRFAGTVAQTCPSTAHQVALDLSPDAADDFVMEPPGFLLHRWDGATLVTHLAQIGDFGGPHPFRAGGCLID